jgi:hypothetical protein
MAILSSGLVDIQAWGANGKARGPLPKWWRWVMLLILVYSSTISVLTGQARRGAGVRQRVPPSAAARAPALATPAAPAGRAVRAAPGARRRRCACARAWRRRCSYAAHAHARKTLAL